MDIVEITLTASAYGGDSIGRTEDGRAVFVPFGIAGETVRVRIVEEKKNFLRAEIVEILQPSEKRIKPKCIHYGVCGGCHYQHLSYQDELSLKENILRDQLMRIGKIENPPVQKMIPSPNEWNYRNHVQFHLDENGKLGFVDAASKNILAVSECHLPEAALDSLWKDLSFEAKSSLERISLRAGNDDALLILESDDLTPPELEIEADVSVVHVNAENTVVIAGEEHIFITVLQKSFRVSANSFFQVNTPMAEKMVEYLLNQLPVSQSANLLDLYCGVGLFSAFFAEHVKKVIGVELSESACADFAFNLDAFDNVELYEDFAENVLPQIKTKIDVVIADPPRAGLDKRVVDALIKLSPQVIAYVSCDPSTLARDAARLIQHGYILKQVTPFDLFPQTYHIESISIFELIPR